MDIVWLSVKQDTPARGYWDQRLLEDFFQDAKHHVTVDGLDGAVVVIPVPYQKHLVREINAELAKLKWCVVILTSDEENLFPIDALAHPNMRIFSQYYNSKYKSDIHWLPIGAAHSFNGEFPHKDKDFAFAGQVTHQAREDFVAELRKRDDGVLIETQGFAQGLEPEDYFKLLSSAKVAPAPRGNVSPDTFRTWEAIEAGAVPIATGKEWHEETFGGVPFPIIENYEQVNGYINDSIRFYPMFNNQIQAWWIMAKRRIKKSIEQAVIDLSGTHLYPTPVSVLVPCSPVKSHPDTRIIDETIKSIVHHQPKAEIFVMFDGVREEQEDRRDDYEEFKRRFLWKCFHDPDYRNIIPLIFNEHSHQVKMSREALQYVDTDYVLFVEQDTPLCIDREIDWYKCYHKLQVGEANMIRFHFEASIPEPHKHMMIGEPEGGFLKTSQWSSRPHLITKAYFERILTDYFTPEAICFVEDKMHGVVSNAYTNNGLNGWFQHRVYIYFPEGDIKRSYHIDGREGAPKWDDKQIW